MGGGGNAFSKGSIWIQLIKFYNVMLHTKLEPSLNVIIPQTAPYQENDFCQRNAHWNLCHSF